MTQLPRILRNLRTLLAPGLALAACLLTLCLAPGGALAQPADFPSKPITIVVPFPPGGISDQLARAIGQQMSESLKVTVIVDNKPGGGAQIAAGAVKQAPADGHTIFLGDLGALSLNAFLYPRLNYDPQKDFTPLARLVLTPSLLVLPANSPYTTFDELIKATRSKAGGLNIASQGNGTAGHIFIEMLRAQSHGNVNHVPYRGSMPGLMDVAGGQVDAMYDAIVSSGPLVKDGKLKAIAVGAPARLAAFPNLPTLQELGYPGLSLTAWFGMLVKAGTPAPVVNRLSEAVIAALKQPEVSRRFTDQGVEVAPLGPQDFKVFMDTEAQRWSKVIRDAGIKLD
jgi:tripartite-type tricarboxylate transporter receptor subunit TctC